MNARRALPDADLATPEPFIAKRAGLDEGYAPRRGQIETACRALIDSTDATAPVQTLCARRALVDEPTMPELADTKILPAIETFARKPRRRVTARQFLAAGSLVAVASGFSGIAIAASSAQTTQPGSAVTTQIVDLSNRESISRDTARAELTDQATPAAGEIESDVEILIDQRALAAAAADAENKARAAAEAQAALDAAAAAAAFAASPSTIYAPGQHAPASVDEAMAKAAQMTGNWGYQNMCLSLVATFYGYTSAGEVGAQQAARTIINAGQMNYDMTNIPVGALIWYDGTPIGNPYGHVAMYAGDGMVYSNGAPTGVGLIPLEEPATGWKEPIIGWSTVWLPSATK